VGGKIQHTVKNWWRTIYVFQKAKLSSMIKHR